MVYIVFSVSFWILIDNSGLSFPARLLELSLASADENKKKATKIKNVKAFFPTFIIDFL